MLTKSKSLKSGCAHHIRWFLMIFYPTKSVHIPQGGGRAHLPQGGGRAGSSRHTSSNYP